MTSPVLHALGSIPSTLVSLDFETYYSADYSLSKLTTERYIRDPRFETIGVGVKVGDRPSVWMEAHDFRVWASRVPWQKTAVLAHHAHFDGLVLSHHYGIRPGFWFDALSMSRALRGASKGNGLAPLAEHYGAGRKGHELEAAKGKRRRDFTPAEWLAYGGYCNNDNELARALFGIMLRGFSAETWARFVAQHGGSFERAVAAARALPWGFPREELWLIDTTIRMFTEPAFVVNQDVLATALAQEREKKRQFLARVAAESGHRLPPTASDEALLEACRATLSSNPKFAALLRAMGHEPGTKPGKPKKDGTPTVGFAFAKSDSFMQGLLEHEDPETRAAAEARLAVKSTIIETRTQRFAGIGRRGKFTVYLKYAGAHTLRWSGGDKQNAQNQNRVKANDPNSGALRRSLEAGEGEVVVAVDSAQIEARVTPWVAGETSVLDTFRRLDALGYDTNGEPLGDFYSERGSVYFGKRLSKKTTPIERQTAKSMELGLGFGQGWFSFAANLLKGFMGAPPVQFTGEQVALFGVDVRDFRDAPQWRDGPTGAERVAELADTGARLKEPGPDALLVHCAVTAHLVRLYRRSNARVAAFWKTCDRLLEVMAPEEGDPAEVRMRLGPLEMMRHAIRKPNGTVLRYPKLHHGSNGYCYWGWKEGREQWLSVYGGLLTENVVQSLARDIVAEQALWIRADGYRIATTTHDEVVSVVPEAEGPRALERMLARMKAPPAWCRDLPLNASGALARSYGDAK